MNKSILIALLCASLVGCERETLTIPPAEYETSSIDDEYETSSIDDELESEELLVSDNDGIDLGDVAIGMIAAELIDEVGDAFESKSKTKQTKKTSYKSKTYRKK